MILDAFSRKVVGWELDRTLGEPIANRGVGESDRGRESRLRVWCITPIVAVQYCFRRICEILNQARDDSQHEPARRTRTTMPAARASSRRLKREEIYANEYEDLDTCAGNIEEFIEQLLQSEAAALSIGLSLAGGVRTASRVPKWDGRFEGGDTHFLRQLSSIFYRAAGEGDSSAVPFPRPHPC